MDEFLNKVTKLIRVEDLMTKFLFFYDEKNEEKNLGFCKKRDIEYLPIKDSPCCMHFNKESGKFINEEITNSMKLGPNINIEEFIERTKNKEIFFVFLDKEIVGVIHFCDLGRYQAYIYLYALFSIFERTIRKELNKTGLENEDIFNWLKSGNKDKKKVRRIEQELTKMNLPDFQQFEFRDLLNFIIQRGVLLSNKNLEPKITHLIADVRNKIMHHKDIAERKTGSDPNTEFLYNRQDYEKFLRVYDFIKGVIDYDKS